MTGFPDLFVQSLPLLFDHEWERFLRLVLVRTPSVIFALAFHEWAHAWVACRVGDPSPRLLGRKTLNPLRHIDPVGLGVFLVFGYGWSRPIPINPLKLKRKTRDIFLITISGPVFNLGLAFFAGFLFYGLGLHKFSFFFNPGAVDAHFLVMYLADLLGYFVVANFVLFVFNVLPVMPLDGSRFLLIFSTSRYMKVVLKYQVYGIIVLLFLIITGIANWFMAPIVELFQGMIIRLSQYFG
ncbi:MAG TPA: site-2 protease family protein [Thermotogota bacterium]|nr:site-2 protease family protein [Thermotogota bacterium]HRW91471.1 site-2 protease family protein [Thermotogota bacterium]